MFYRNNTPYMCDGPNPFQKQMSKQERHFSSVEFAWRYRPLSFIQNSIEYTEFCRVGKSQILTVSNIVYDETESKFLMEFQ